MANLLLLIPAMLAGATPSLRNAAMPASDTPPETAAAASPWGDTPAEAKGRRILSTAFVRIGPDGFLTVEVRGQGGVVLRDVVMRRRKYCGVPVSGGTAGVQYCGRYDEVLAARPGGAPGRRDRT